MRNRRPSPDHAEAVARRLALLEAELDAARRSSSSTPPADPEEDTADSGEPVSSPVTRVPESLPVPEKRVRTDAWEPLEADEVAWVDLIDEGPAGPATRVRPEIQAPVVASGPTGAPVASLVPEPGRHARRRGGSVRPAELLEAAGVDVRFTPAHLAVVATLVVAALGITCWWLLAGRVEPVMSPVAAPVRTVEPGASANVAPSAAASVVPSAAPGAATPPVAGGDAGPVEIVVDVAGKVRRPGIVVLAAGARVADAIEAAGGARRGVDLSPLNLARPLVDGEQVLVGVVPPQGSAGPAGGTQPGATAPGAVPPGGALVNINLATLEELDTLPGVGPVTAQAIVDWRTRHGGFTAVDDLLEVDGIGPATLAKLAPLVTL